MLWIAHHFPQLSIDAFGGGHGQTLLQNLPLVIHDGKPQRPVLYAVNQAARTAGLQPGMALAAARAVTVVRRVTANRRTVASGNLRERIGLTLLNVLTEGKRVCLDRR